eukprot:tig00000478_g1269.t1
MGQKQSTAAQPEVKVGGVEVSEEATANAGETLAATGVKADAGKVAADKATADKATADNATADKDAADKDAADKAAKKRVVDIETIVTDQDGKSGLEPFLRHLSTFFLALHKEHQPGDTAKIALAMTGLGALYRLIKLALDYIATGNKLHSSIEAAVDLHGDGAVREHYMKELDPVGKELAAITKDLQALCAKLKQSCQVQKLEAMVRCDLDAMEKEMTNIRERLEKAAKDISTLRTKVEAHKLSILVPVPVGPAVAVASGLVGVSVGIYASILAHNLGKIINNLNSVLEELKGQQASQEELKGALLKLADKVGDMKTTGEALFAAFAAGQNVSTPAAAA